MRPVQPLPPVVHGRLPALDTPANDEGGSCKEEEPLPKQSPVADDAGQSDRTLAEVLRHELRIALPDGFRELGEQLRRDVREEIQHILTPSQEPILSQTLSTDRRLSPTPSADRQISPPQSPSSVAACLAVPPVPAERRTSVASTGSAGSETEDLGLGSVAILRFRSAAHRKAIEGARLASRAPPKTHAAVEAKRKSVAGGDGPNLPRASVAGAISSIFRTEPKPADVSAKRSSERPPDWASENGSFNVVPVKVKKLLAWEGRPNVPGEADKAESNGSHESPKFSKGVCFMGDNESLQQVEEEDYLRDSGDLNSILEEEDWEDDKGSKSRCRYVATRIVQASHFDSVSCLLVCLNTISIGIQTDFMARSGTEICPASLRLVETLFCIAFTLEILLRIYVYRFQFFVMKGFKWNIFDLVVVSLQVVEETFTIAASVIDTGTQMSNFSFMRVLRILRLIRIMRVVRVLRLIRELRTIVMSIGSSFKSLFWTVVLLNLVIYITALYITQVVLNFRVNNDTVHDEKLYRDFGSLTSSIYVLYQSISNGVEWGQLAQPLVKQISPMMGVFFACYVAFVTLAVLNTVTGIFVESVVENAKVDRDEYLMNLVRQLFTATVRDNSGMVSWEEFEGHLDNKYMVEFFQAIDVDISDAQAVFKLLDVDGSGMLDFDEFLNGCLRLRGPARALELTAMMHDTCSNQRKQCMLAHQLQAQVKEVLDVNNRMVADLGSVMDNLSTKWTSA